VTLRAPLPLVSLAAALAARSDPPSCYSDDELLGGAPHGDEGALMIEWQEHS
jgi:hypothetical protein